jgi:hypothetical protein
MTATLNLKADALTEHRVRAGLTTDRALARAAGLDPANVHRVLKGRQDLGPRFIAGLVSAFPGLTLDDLFAVECPEGGEAA